MSFLNADPDGPLQAVFKIHHSYLLIRLWAGQYKKQNLIARYGVDIRLPDLREEIAKCDRHRKMHDACMVRYVDLIPNR
jgi:hypothetical protein